LSFLNVRGNQDFLSFFKVSANFHTLTGCLAVISPDSEGIHVYSL